MQIDGASIDKRSVRFPERFVRGSPKRRPDEGHDSSLGCAMRKLLEQRRHLRGHNAKHPRILECEPQRPVATHGDAADAPSGAVPYQAEFLLHLWDKVTNKKIFITDPPVSGIDVETRVSIGRDDHHFANLLLLLRIFDHVPTAGGNQKALVSAQPVEVVERWKFLCWLRVITRRQQCAIPDWRRHVWTLD